jgi:hypothetical protein
MQNQKVKINPGKHDVIKLMKNVPMANLPQMKIRDWLNNASKLSIRNLTKL